MKASAWLVIELRDQGRWPRTYAPVITKVVKRRPTNQMAVHITLDFEDDAFQPHVEKLVNLGLISLEIEEPPSDEPEEETVL